jgi:hypothetical protein
MNTWRLMLAHHVAHLNPTLTTGTAVAGYPVGSIRTLNPNERGRVAEATNRVDLDFNRGASAAHNPVDCLFMAGVKYQPTAALQVLDSTAADFGAGTFTELVNDATNVLDLYVPTLRCFTAFATSTLRYLRYSIIYAGSVTFEFGTVSFGKQYSLGTDLYAGASESADAPALATGSGGQIITRSFDTVTDADAAAILAAWRADSILTTDNAAIDGWGQRAGQRYGVLAKFASSTDLVSSACYYGNINLTVEPKYEGKSQVNVSVRCVPLGPLH